MATSAPSSWSQLEQPTLSSSTRQSQSGPSGLSLQKQPCLKLLWCAADCSERSLQQCARANCNCMKWHTLTIATCNDTCIPITIVLCSWSQRNQSATCTCKLQSRGMADSSKSILKRPVHVNHDFCEWLIPVKTALVVAASKWQRKKSNGLGTESLQIWHLGNNQQETALHKTCFKRRKKKKNHVQSTLSWLLLPHSSTWPRMKRHIFTSTNTFQNCMCLSFILWHTNLLTQTQCSKPSHPHSRLFHSRQARHQP